MESDYLPHALTTILALFSLLIGVGFLVVWGERTLLYLLNRPVDSSARVPGQSRVRWITAGLLAVVALATIPSLGQSTLFDRDEGYYAESARDMLARTDLFVPRIQGEAWLEKPPLTYWGMMLSMAALGRTEFAARLPSALFGLLLIWLTMHLARRLFDPASAFLAGLILASCTLVLLTMSHVLLDTALACCVTMSMIGLWDWTSGQRRRGFWLFYVGCGLGVIAKGPLGAALPVFGLLGFLCLTRRWSLIKEIAPLRGALVALAVASIWALPATILTHGEYLHELVWVRTLQPIFSPLQHHGGRNTAAYLAMLPAYLPILLLGLGMWAPFLLPALRERWLRKRDGNQWPFLVGWGGAQLLAFSLVSTKLAHYILPILPCAAILIAGFLVDRLRQDPTGAALLTRTRIAILATAGVLVGGLLLAVPAALGFSQFTLWFAPAAVVAALSGFWVWHDRNRGRAVRALMGAAAATLLCVGLLSILAVPRFDEGKSARSIASFLKERYTSARFAELRIGLLDYRQYSVLYYLNRDAIGVDPGQIQSFLEATGPAVVLLPESKLDSARRAGLTAPHEVIWQKRAWTADKNRWDEICLISNGK